MVTRSSNNRSNIRNSLNKASKTNSRLHNILIKTPGRKAKGVFLFPLARLAALKPWGLPAASTASQQTNRAEFQLALQ